MQIQGRPTHKTANQKTQIDKARDRLNKLAKAVSDENVTSFKQLYETYERSRAAAALVSADLFSDEPLPQVGSDVWRSLWEAADRDIDRTQRGIVVIDEVDKIARRGSGGGGSQGRDVGGEGVQQALLKLIESSQVNIQTDMGRVMRNELVQIDTSNILFIFCGAFVGIEQLIQQRMSPGSIGFGAQKSSSSKDKDYNDLIQHIRTEDLIRFGLIPEFIGRLPVVVPLESLSKEALKAILWKPKSSLVRQYQRLLMLNNIELEFTEEAMDEIVEDAIKRKAGARGLRSVMERIMLDVMYRAPDTPDGQKRCIINENVVRGLEQPAIDTYEIA